MNAAWAKEWAANFANLDKLMDMYAADAQFEAVITAHKESGKAEMKKFFAAAGNPESVNGPGTMQEKRYDTGKAIPCSGKTIT